MVWKIVTCLPTCVIWMLIRPYNEIITMKKLIQKRITELGNIKKKNGRLDLIHGCTDSLGNFWMYFQVTLRAMNPLNLFKTMDKKDAELRGGLITLLCCQMKLKLLPNDLKIVVKDWKLSPSLWLVRYAKLKLMNGGYSKTRLVNNSFMDFSR